MDSFTETYLLNGGLESTVAVGLGLVEDFDLGSDVSEEGWVVLVGDVGLDLVNTLHGVEDVKDASLLLGRGEVGVGPGGDLVWSDGSAVSLGLLDLEGTFGDVLDNGQDVSGVKIGIELVDEGDVTFEIGDATVDWSIDLADSGTSN